MSDPKGKRVHPDGALLQSYLDGELGHSSRQRLQKHLARCLSCRNALQTWAQISHALHQSIPPPNLFASEGEFWARLVGKLPRQRPAPWSWVAYLPPLVLGFLGTAIKALLTLVFIANPLLRLGLIPSPREAVPGQLATLLSWSWLDDSFYNWMGWSSNQVANQVTREWASMPLATQDMILVLAAILMLGVMLVVIVALYLFWAMFWPHSVSSEDKGGR